MTDEEFAAAKRLRVGGVLSLAGDDGRPH